MTGDSDDEPGDDWDFDCSNGKEGCKETCDGDKAACFKVRYGEKKGGEMHAHLSYSYTFMIMGVVYICTVSVWLTGRRARRSSGFDVGVGGGVGGDRGSFQAVTGKGKQPAF